MYETSTELLESFPHYSRLADRVGVCRSQINSWRDRNSIPSSRWLRLIAAAKAEKVKGVNLGLLAKLAEERG